MASNVRQRHHAETEAVVQWVMGGLRVGGSAELTAEQSASEGPSPCSEDPATCSSPQPD